MDSVLAFVRRSPSLLPLNVLKAEGYLSRTKGRSWPIYSPPFPRDIADLLRLLAFLVFFVHGLPFLDQLPLWVEDFLPDIFLTFVLP